MTCDSNCILITLMHRHFLWMGLLAIAVISAVVPAEYTVFTDTPGYNLVQKALSSQLAPETRAISPEDHTALIEEPQLLYAKTPPYTRARAVFSADTSTHKPLVGWHEEKVWPLASLTKIMTALVYIEHDPNPDAYVTLSRGDRVGGTMTWLPVGSRVRADDLLHAALMGSANDAAHALPRALGLTPREFVRRMNERAHELGLDSTRFVETTGLHAKNVSTAREFSVVLQKALEYPRVREVLQKRSHWVQPVNARGVSIGNANLLVGRKNGFTITGGKTGLIGLSGYNFALQAERGGKEVVAVVLGDYSLERSFRSVTSLIKESFDVQTEKEVATETTGK